MKLDEQILKLKIQIEKETNKDIKKILLVQKQYLDQLRSDIGNIFMKYADVEGNLYLSNVERIKEMKKIEKSLITMKTVLAEKIIAITNEALTKSYVNSYYKTANIINDGVEVGINFQLLKPEFVVAIVNANFEGQTFSQRIWKHQEQLILKLYDVIGKGIVEGTNVRKLSKEIKNTFGVTAYQSRRLVNTEMARVVSQAQDQIYNDSEIVKKVIWIATLDSKTNPEDARLDGTIWELNDPSRPRIPLHPNCRCATAPYLEDWKPTVRREQSSKTVIPYKTYSDWQKDN